MTTPRTTLLHWLTRGAAGARADGELWELDDAATYSPAARGLDL